MAVGTKNAPWYTGSQGSTNLMRTIVQQRAREILESDDYKASLNRRIKSDTLPPGVETMLWHYAFGKPAETLNVNMNEDLSKLSMDELLERARSLGEKIEEIKAVEDAIPVEYKVA